MNNLILEKEMVFVSKGWGWERWVCNYEHYCGKILHFFKDKKCSFHYHVVKDEVLYLQSGKILLKHSFEDDLDKAVELVMIPGMAFHVRPGMRHQMIALEESEIIEFSTHHEDSDSLRIIKGD